MSRGSVECAFGNGNCAAVFPKYSGDYKVIYTDYDNYTIVHICTGYFVGILDFVWIISKNKVFTDE